MSHRWMWVVALALVVALAFIVLYNIAIASMWWLIVNTVFMGLYSRGE
jgi:hypothetical protein